MARTGMDPDDGQRFRPSAKTQVEDLPMFAYPAPSQPRKGSEQSADKLVATGRAKSLRLLALERLAKGPITADALRGELEELLGREVAANSIAPRLTELTAPDAVGRSLAEYDDRVENRSRYGATCCPYRITDHGLQVLRELEARRKVRGGSFEDTTGATLP